MRLRGKAARARSMFQDQTLGPVAQDARPCCSRPAIPGRSGPVQRPLQSTSTWRGARFNLCTEITLHTNDNEIAVCNLGSVNLAEPPTTAAWTRQAVPHRQYRHAHAGQRHRHTTTTTCRRRVTQPEAPPGGHGHHGLPGRPVPAAAHPLRQPGGRRVRRPFDGGGGLLRLLASTDLAEERAATSFNGSLWSKGILPIDSLACLAEKRGGYLT